MSNLEKYIDLQADFYHYMVKFAGIAKKTSGDYVTRMKFLAHDYSLDETLTKENIREIYNNCCVELEKLEDENKIQAVG